MAIFSRLFSLMSVAALFKSVYGSSGSGTVGETEGFDHSDDDDDTVYCLDKLECSGDDIDADYVYCDGFYGCYEATIYTNYVAYIDGFRGGQEAEVTSENDVYCGGYIGCFMSEVTSLEGSTTCDGTVSCYNSIIYSYNNIYLFGFKAATASDLFGNSTDVTLYAYGAYSALYSIINNVETIYNLGLYGLYFADIFTDDIEDNSFTMVNYGRLSTYYAQLYCAHKVTCNIYCRDYGCYGFEIWLAKGATVNVYYNDESCDSSPTLVYARNGGSSSSSSSLDEIEFRKQFSARKEMKSEAKKEFAKKYKREINSFKTEKDFIEFDVATKFEEIAQQVQERMGMDRGVLEGLHVYKTNVINSDDQQEIMQTNKVIDIAHYKTGNNNNQFDWESAGFGMIAGVTILALGLTTMKCFGSGNKLSIIKNKSDGYTYQSI